MIEELLAACESALGVFEDMLGPDCDEDCECILHTLRAAIDHARAETHQ